MEAINLSKWKYKHLKYYILEENVVSTEGTFYYNPYNKKELLKLYDTLDKKYLEYKKDACISIINAKDIINVPELNLPKDLLYVDNEFKGIVIPKITGINSSIILSDNFVSLKSKLDILKQIGSILQRIKENGKDLNLSFSDVHPDNFMIDRQNTVIGIDTDSMTIKNYQGRINYFLHKNPWISKIDKYHTGIYGLIDPDSNTDIFCFIMMILNVLSGEKIYTLSLDDYKKYLDKLDKLGINSDLLKACASLYENGKNNINPYLSLDNISFNEENQEYIKVLKH